MFTMPEGWQDLDAAGLAELRAKITEAINEINGKDGDLDQDEMDALEALLTNADEVDAKVEEIETAAAADEARRAALRERAEKATAAPEAEAEEEDDEDDEDDPDAKVDADADKEAVVAAGTKRQTVAALSTKKAPAPPKKPAPKASIGVITAAGKSTSEFAPGDELGDMSKVAEAFLARVGDQGFHNDPDMKPGIRQMSPNFTRHPVAKITRNEREGATVNKEMSLEEQMSIIMAASDERGKFGSKGLAQTALTAAGGWCAPSETIYELFGYETNAGLLDIPEVTARRGGISFTKGPDFMTIFGDADAGFIMTETEAESGSFVKPCYALECPPFTEVRLDAIGFCATAPLLTEAAYPELVRRVLSLLAMGHARRKSAETISRISTLIGTAINWVEYGTAGRSGIADFLAGVELQALRIKQTLAMDPNATIEGVAPFWLRPAFRNELARRLGLPDPFNVTDADVDRWLATRNIRLQWVYDYQMLGTGAVNTAGGTATWTGYPEVVEVMLWPAGAFTRLVNDVANLSAVYDHELLTGNEYTAAFVEEGIAVANTRGFGVKMSVNLNYNGASGFPAIGAGDGVTFDTV